MEHHQLNLLGVPRQVYPASYLFGFDLTLGHFSYLQPWNKKKTDNKYLKIMTQNHVCYCSFCITLSANTLKTLAITATTASCYSIDPFSAKQQLELAKQIRCTSGYESLTTGWPLSTIAALWKSPNISTQFAPRAWLLCAHTHCCHCPTSKALATHPRHGCKVSQWARLCVCWLAHLKNDISKRHFLYLTCRRGPVHSSYGNAMGYVLFQFVNDIIFAKSRRGKDYANWA